MKKELQEAIRRVRGSLEYHINQQFTGYGEAAHALAALDVIEKALQALEPEPLPTRATLIRCLELALKEKP